MNKLLNDRAPRGVSRSLAERTLRSQIPKVGAQCVNHARWDLCGGCSAMGIPTAIGPLVDALSESEVVKLHYSAFLPAVGESDALFSSASVELDPLNPLEIAPRNSELGVRFFSFGVVIPIITVDAGKRCKSPAADLWSYR
jgi:hypothetical protein